MKKEIKILALVSDYDCVIAEDVANDLGLSEKDKRKIKELGDCVSTNRFRKALSRLPWMN